MEFLIEFDAFGTAISSLTVVAFNEATVCEVYYTNISLRSCLEVGLQLDAGSIERLMYMKEDEQEAQLTDAVPISAALTQLQSIMLYYSNNTAKTVWGDNLHILRQAITATGKVVPWAEHEEYSYRTVEKLLQLPMLGSSLERAHAIITETCSARRHRHLK